MNLEHEIDSKFFKASQVFYQKFRQCLCEYAFEDAQRYFQAHQFCMRRAKLDVYLSALCEGFGKGDLK